ncbi:MAG TPA: hypothetical protein VMY87_06350 [Armatimonadota bacterium]|nr:hypothetical protein [Armatimonadota bacterium]
MTELQIHRRVRIVLAWFDIWIGAYWNREKRRLYLFPIPCVGLRVDFAKAK